MYKYKIAIIGFGSIGKRHLKNIIDELNERSINFEIDLVRQKNSSDLDIKVESLISSVYYRFEEVPSDYDLMFITNPTYLHFDTIKMFADKTKHMFIEKPVFDCIPSDLMIKHLNLKSDSIYYVACPLRYSKVIQYIKNEIDLDLVYSARIICSSYLPEWRSGTDYRSTYSAHKDQGGGVSIDLIHEIDYTTYLFGMPSIIYNLAGKFSDLEIDCEDLSIYVAKFQGKLVELHLDYFGRYPIREIQMFSQNDTIIADLIKSQIKFLKSGVEISFDESKDDFYKNEIKYFFDVIDDNSKEYNNITTAVNTLKIALEGKL